MKSMNKFATCVMLFTLLSYSLTVVQTQDEAAAEEELPP